MSSTQEYQRFANFAQQISWIITEGYVVDLQVVAMQEILINNPDIKTVFEIGFNSGCSAAAFLSARPDITVLSVDLGLHDYVLKGKRLIDQLYPGRHTLVIGDSTDVVPRLAKLLNTPFDFFFIDGGHEDPVPRLDIHNCRALCKPTGSIVCIDDWCKTYGKCGVNQAIDDAMRAGVLQGPASRGESGDRGWGIFIMRPKDDRLDQ